MVDADEKEVLDALVQRHLAVENGEDGTTKAYIRIVGRSASMSRATKVSGNVRLAGTRESVLAQLLARVKVAKEVGGRIWVQVLHQGDSHPIDQEALDGEAVSAEGEAMELSERAEGAHQHAPAIANAHVVAGLLAEHRWMSAKLIEHLERTEEVKIAAAAAMARLELLQEIGGRAELAQALKDYAPAIEKALPEALRIYILHQELSLARAKGRTAAEGDAVPREPADRVRARMADVEAAVQSLVAEAAAAQAAGELTPELLAELRERAAPLLAAFGVGQ